MLRLLASTGVLALLSPVSHAWPELSPQLRDLAARIDYGFYSEDDRVLEAARSSLDRLAPTDALANYYAALAAYRLAQIGSTGETRRLGELIEACSDGAGRAAGETELAGESWTLIAACAVLGARHEPLRALAHQRRFAQALEQARSIDDENPRVGLVEVWALSERPGREQAAERDRAAEVLAAVIARYAESGQPDGPGWGEAEAMAHLGEIRLLRGEIQLARDLIEQALLIAPDYRFALSLKDRLSSSP